MIAPQKDTHNLYLENSKEFMDNVVLLKMDSVSNELEKLSERVAVIEKNSESMKSTFSEDKGYTLKKEKDLWGNSIYQTFFSIDERQRRIKVKKENNLATKDTITIQDCKRIIDRALEILSDWSEIQDIKLQIQYAAVITGKIDNLKKTDYIQSNNTRKKVCTLLRNVIRINIIDIVFSKEQISLLKKGFILLLSEQIQKKDMLQLNREFLEQQLLTMPAWE